MVLKKTETANAVPAVMVSEGKSGDLLTISYALARVAQHDSLEVTAAALETLEELRGHDCVVNFVHDGGPHVDTAVWALVRLLQLSTDGDADEEEEEEDMPTLDEVAAAVQALHALRAAQQNTHNFREPV